MKLISLEQIKTLAGEAAFERGMAYYNEGKVVQMQVSGTVINATVEGTQLYDVSLQHTAKVFEGSCSCPASDHFDFCKHCVAAALHYYHQTQVDQEFDAKSPQDPIEHFLGTLTKPQLVDALLATIKGNQLAHELWTLRAKSSTGKLAVKEIRKHVTKALPFKASGIWRHREVANYFDDANQRLNGLIPVLDQLSLQDALKLLLYAYERLEKCLQTIDDSGGYRFDLLALLHTRFETYITSDELDTKTRLKFILNLFKSEKFSYELLRDDLDLNTLLSAEENRQLQKHIKQLWQNAPAPTADKLYLDNPTQRFERYLLSFAKARNDTQLELEVLAKSAVSVRRCIDLVHRCLELNKIDEAEKWQHYAAQLETPRIRETQQLEFSQIKIWLAKKEFAKALRAQWAAFQEEPSLQAYKDLQATARHLDQAEQWQKKVTQFLINKITGRDWSRRVLDRSESLIAVYLHENRVSEAIEFAANNKLVPSTLMAVVNASDQLGPTESQIAERAVNFFVDQGSQQTYERAIHFLLKIQDKNASENGAFSDLVNRIYRRPQTKRKINFIKMFKTNFGELLQ